MSDDGRLDRLDYYTLLGLELSASGDEVKVAFRKFARRYHPDKFSGKPEKLERSTRIYRRGSEAYRVLTDPVARRAYDQGLREGRVRLSTDDRDKAEQAERRARAPTRNQGPPIRSPQALAFYRKAGEDGERGEWREAWRAMKKAIDLEPNNEFLRARLSRIEDQIRRRR